MTSLPDWLVERVALDEVPPESRDRLARAAPQELAAQVAALRAENAAELAANPAAVAVAAIEARAAACRRAAARAARPARRWQLGLASLAGVAALGAVTVLARVPSGERQPARPSVPALAQVDPLDEGTRVKGEARLLGFRDTGEGAERLQPGAVVRAGDRIQVRYYPGGASYGVIASIDGAGAVTLHQPSEGAPPEATALAPRPTTLPNAYALDDAPGFERFFFITADRPIDVPHILDVLRALAQRPGGDLATPELPEGLRQFSLLLRKPDPSSNPKSTP
jgi:hypothetical protein